LRSRGHIKIQGIGIKISTGQLNELRKNYPDMTAEYIATEKPDHYQLLTKVLNDIKAFKPLLS
jgi:hypothetical protein